MLFQVISAEEKFRSFKRPTFFFRFFFLIPVALLLHYLLGWCQLCVYVPKQHFIRPLVLPFWTELCEIWSLRITFLITSDSRTSATNLSPEDLDTLSRSLWGATLEQACWNMKMRIVHMGVVCWSKHRLLFKWTKGSSLVGVNLS